MGWAQTGVAAGLIAGSPFGGVLYGLSGRKELPFFVIGGAELLVSANVSFSFFPALPSSNFTTRLGLVGVFGLSQLFIKNYAPRADDVKAKTKESEEAQKEPCAESLS